MKDTINYYYHLNIKELENWGSTYRFSYNNSYYYFTPTYRSSSEINDILMVCEELTHKNIPIHTFIPNIYNKLITNVYNTNYILLKPLVKIDEEYDLNFMIKLNKSLTLNTTKSDLYRFSWPKLWADKIDYFEYQIHELGQNKPLILDSLSYYIGLGENAISYCESISQKFSKTPLDHICLSHRRLKFPNYALNYLNPLSFIFDYEVRDIAEYLKSAFFSGENALNYLKIVLHTNNFSSYSLGLLYARLLYPTYYFDLYEEIMNNEENEELLIPILEKSSAYETFLYQSFQEISKYAPLEPIDWLIKKEL